VQLTRLTASPGCPTANGIARSITFDITSHVGNGYVWRKAAGTADLITPTTGALTAIGVTTVNAVAVVGGEAITIEVVDPAGRVVFTFTLPHR
jgi:hypothetical protein